MVLALAGSAGVGVGGVGAVELDRPTVRLIDDVNRTVNRAFAYGSPLDDPNGDGVFDCENYAAEKMARLVASGRIPAADMALWRATTRNGGSHAVLVIRATRAGRPVELVLDNVSPWTIPRGELSYTEWAPLALDWRMTSVSGRITR